MSSNSDDPVQTVIDILQNTDESNWPNGNKPDIIESRWTSDFRVKLNQTGPAVYVHSPEPGTHDAYSASGSTKVQMETVGVQVWSDAETSHNNVRDDCQTILEDYWNDTDGSTNWDRIRPVSQDDRRQQHIGRRTDIYVTEIRVELERDSSIGP